MNRIKISALSIIVLLGLFAAPATDSIARAQYAVPGCDTATLNGYIETDGYTEVWFEWGEGGSLNNDTSHQSFSSDSDFSARINNLKEDTMYSYRAMSLRSTGQILTFWTNDCGGGAPAEKPTVDFYANPSSMTLPDHYTDLYWNVKNADVCWASSSTTPRWWNENNPVSGFNNKQPIPDLIEGNNYFTLRCENSAGSTSKTITVKVNPAVVTPQPKNVLPKGYLDFASCSEINGWAFGSNYATISVELTDGINSVTTRADQNRQDVGDVYPDAGDWHGFKIATPSVFKDFSSKTIHAYALDTSGSRVHLGTSPKTIPACKTQVQPPPTPPPSPPPQQPPAQPPTVNLTANPSSIQQGQSSTLSWTSQNANYCNASWTTSFLTSGSMVVSPSSTTTYSILCVGHGGQATDTETVVVTQAQAQAPTVNLTANPSSIQQGQSSTLTWTSQNTNSCSASWTTSTATTGSRVVAPPFTTTYSITCFGNGGQATDTETVTVAAIGAPTVNLTANPSSIQQGQSSTLSWTSQNATSCSASWTTSTATSGSRSVSPGSTTTYSIICFGNGGQATDTETVTVTQIGAPTVNLTANPTNIQQGQSSTLSWTSQNADSCSASWTTSNGTSGSRIVAPGSTTTYSITCFGNGGQATDTETVTVSTTGGNNLPTVNLRADDTSIDEGEETELTWSSTNADYCVRTGGRNGWSDDRVSTSGNFDTGDLTRDTEYDIRCHNQFGSADDSETVRVNEDDDDDRQCLDSNALNYRGSYPCRYLPPITPNAQRPTVVLYADQTSLAYNGTTFIRWSTVGATSCEASGGSVGWAGTKSIGPGSFFTGSLSSSRTYNLTCYNASGSDTDSVTVSVRQPPTTGGPRQPAQPATSLVLVTSSIDRNQAILPTLDNTRPRPGDEITYTVNYQNIGTGAIRNLVLRLDLPYEVVYLYSTPSNPIMSANTLIFNLGTLPANGSGTVTVRVRVREDAPPGALLNFPAILSYIDPAGFPQTVTANVSAQVWNMQPITTVEDNANLLGAAAFLSGGFWPTTLFGWLLLIILILLLVLLAKYLMDGNQPFERRTTTTTIQH